MSITISAAAGTTILGILPEAPEPCLCAQMSPAWAFPLPEDFDRAELAAYANKGCRSCDGSGVESVVQRDHNLYLNLCNANAWALFTLLGFSTERDSCTIFEARRAVMKANATFDRRAVSLLREGGETRGPVRREDGTVELRALRSSERSFTAEDLRARLDAFVDLVRVAGAAGADRLVWS